MKYEDLVQAPAETIKTIFEYLGVGFETINLDRAELPDSAFYQLGYHDQLKNPLHTQRIGRWEEVLSPEQLELIKPIIEAPMKKLSYL